MPADLGGFDDENDKIIGTAIFLRRQIYNAGGNKEWIKTRSGIGKKL